jgi:Asp-tRNA(Asn)/Glu-tRNA(Gln) amidotransferase A subunit family amidase
VAAAFATAVEALGRAGATIAREPAPEVLEARALIAEHGAIAGIEADAVWHETIAADPAAVFHMVGSRITAGAKQSGRDLVLLHEGFARLASAFAARIAGCDAMIAPTVPGDPPAIAPLLESDEAYLKANAMSLANTAPGNWLVCSAISVPCGGARLPVGLMLMQRAGFEGQLLRLAAAAERALAPIPKPRLD